MSFKQFSLLIDGTADAAFAVDASGRISAWNNAAAQLFGFSEEEVIGVKCHQVLQCADENGPISPEHCVIEYTARNPLARMNFDLRLRTKVGKLWCNLSTLIANDASGVRHAICIVRRCEMRKRLEQALSEFVRMQASPGWNYAPLTSSTAATDVNVPLTARELEVLKRLAKGDNTRTIANQLNISSATVNNHIKHILTKLDVHTRLEAIRHAESTGMI